MNKFVTRALSTLLLASPALAFDSIVPWETVHEAGGTRTQLHDSSRQVVLIAVDALTEDYVHIRLTASIQGSQHRLGAVAAHCNNGTLGEVVLSSTPLDEDQLQRDYRELRTRQALEHLHHAPRIRTLEEQIRQRQLAAPQTAREAALLRAACLHQTETRPLPGGGEYRADKFRHNVLHALPGSKQLLILQADKQSLTETDAKDGYQRFLLPLTQQDGVLRFEVQEVLLAANGTLAAGSQRLHWQEVNCHNAQARELRDLRPPRAPGESGPLRYVSISFRDPALRAREEGWREALAGQPSQELFSDDANYFDQLEKLCLEALRPRTSNLYSQERLHSAADRGLALFKPEEWRPIDIILSYFQDPLPLAAYDCRVVQPPAGVSHQHYRDFQNALTSFVNCDNDFITKARAFYEAPEQMLREHDRRRFLPAHRELALNTLRARVNNLMEKQSQVAKRQHDLLVNYKQEYERWAAANRQ